MPEQFNLQDAAYPDSQAGNWPVLPSNGLAEPEPAAAAVREPRRA